MDGPALPIRRSRRQLVEAVLEQPFLIVTGETGSGKSTQLPKYLYEAGPLRRLHLRGGALGTVLGDTAIRYMTDGCLLRQILTDPLLSKYSVIVLDEAHERSLSTDILFGLLKKLFLQEKPAGRRTDMKVVVMSATLEVEKLSEFFGHCSVLHIPGRSYPVKEIFCNLLSPRDVGSSAYVTEAVKVTLDVHLNEPEGDILVFLTGQNEIERACDLLFKKAESIDYRYEVHDRAVEGLLILPLYGSMSTDQQKRIFLPAPRGIRKCVVSTNIAATSLTIEGVRYVVDSGFVKQLNHNPRVGLDILEVVPISKSEAKQRAGRAGRTSAGKSFGLYSREFWEQCMPQHTVPEIRRSSLTSVILTLKCLSVHDVIRFPYLDPPEERHILEALKELYQCNAIDRRGHVTRLGEFLVQFPLPPNLSCAVLKAASLDCEDLLLPIAAMLSVENVFIRPGDPQKQKEAELQHQELASQVGGCNDFATLLNIFEQCKLPDFPKETFEGSKTEILRRCLCAGYFINVARRSAARTFCTMDGHGSIVYIHPSSTLYNQETQLEWIIFHDVAVTSKIYVRTVCPVRYEWVRDLLPRLHQVDAYELSSVAREEVTEEEITKWQQREELKRQFEGVTENSARKMERRNDDQSIQDARARYLQRKQQRAQALSSPEKETG
ncbi:putative ATP-dependent RNA helicase DHX40 [Lonchura striata]|uniref:RNA helicase n=1 Tax=Lonchura striata TaxID=40157 RepID=A0A218UUM5_9PASE|nr:putative ATP-dependent RNA helicase DHX40 [Lonchura striata domestica]